METSALFSPGRTWRYTLTRQWDPRFKPMACIGLNPSTADETQDDPTIRRIINFAKDWGYGGLVMLNLFAFRATDPRDMKAAPDPIGPGNDDAIMRETDGRTTLCAWGNHGGHLSRSAFVVAMLMSPSRRLIHLGMTGQKQPRHPLYVRGDTRPIGWSALAEGGDCG